MARVAALVRLCHMRLKASREAGTWKAPSSTDMPAGRPCSCKRSREGGRQGLREVTIGAPPQRPSWTPSISAGAGDDTASPPAVGGGLWEALPSGEGRGVSLVLHPAACIGGMRICGVAGRGHDGGPDGGSRMLRGRRTVRLSSRAPWSQPLSRERALLQLQLLRSRGQSNCSSRGRFRQLHQPLRLLTLADIAQDTEARICAVSFDCESKFTRCTGSSCSLAYHFPNVSRTFCTVPSQTRNPFTMARDQAVARPNVLARHGRGIRCGSPGVFLRGHQETEPLPFWHGGHARSFFFRREASSSLRKVNSIVY